VPGTVFVTCSSYCTPISGFSARSAQPKQLTIFPPRTLTRDRSGSVALSVARAAWSLSKSASTSKVSQS
jgi:hypothetical protein